MARGFVYIVSTVGKDYCQPSLVAVPTWFKDRIYFGPCKRSMRPRMKTGDFIFGLSPSGVHPRRIVFGTRIAEKLTFREAYHRFSDLRGPDGPIHVRPVNRPGLGFPDDSYKHISGANHPNDWRADLRTPELDAFYVCEPFGDCIGRWFGANGPTLHGKLLEFLRTCEVWGKAGLLSRSNRAATVAAPIRHGQLYTGLHLETDRPNELASLICDGRPAQGQAIESSPPLRATRCTPTQGRRAMTRKCADAAPKRIPVASVHQANCGLLVRVGADQSDGGGLWNGPVDSKSGRFVYVPIPERKPQRPNLDTPYRPLRPALAKLQMELPRHLVDERMHLDPDFEHLTYGDRGKKGQQLLRSLSADDLIIFYAGLRDTSSRLLVYAIIGLFVVKTIRLARDSAPSEAHRNAHTRRVLPADADDVIVQAVENRSGRLTRCIPIGEYRANAYRVSKPILDAWGGLSVNDGYMQRSAVFPSLSDPDMFLKWWNAQKPELVSRNNLG